MDPASNIILNLWVLNHATSHKFAENKKNIKSRRIFHYNQNISVLLFLFDTGNQLIKQEKKVVHKSQVKVVMRSEGL